MDAHDRHNGQTHVSVFVRSWLRWHTVDSHSKVEWQR